MVGFEPAIEGSPQILDRAMQQRRNKVNLLSPKLYGSERGWEEMKSSTIKKEKVTRNEGKVKEEEDGRH
ncbi:hypothetical protein PoB_007094400 [Plakobranchus ocellatus]|uniref:Uncharacterized protein n=1 Tax=Plakobranchus ocellatus TaxID=259542 RepID=A0AAV4DJS4_9GAST|nr:hypothetical protein PoB_007094400 [Plakobranchus ocellatus]